MHKQPPKSPFQHPLFPPTVAEVLDTSPGVNLNGNVETAWKLVANLDFRDGDIRLALAVGCLCRELRGWKPAASLREEARP